MPKKIAYLAALLAGLLGVAGCSENQGNRGLPGAEASGQNSPFTQKQFSDLRSYVSQTLTTEHIPGMALAVVYHGHIVFFDGAGYADVGAKTAVTQQTVFPIGSVTKSMTGIAILQLRDEGKIKLTDKVTKYLPWFKLGGPYSSDDITLYDLLTQSSGIPSDAPATVLQVLNYNDTPSTIEAGVRALAEVQLVSKPGTTFNYSNMNYAILGLIVQQVSQQSYESYMTSHVFAPLGMSQTTFSTNPANEATLYQTSTSPTGPVSPLGNIYNFEDPAGMRLRSSIQDMAQYVSFELGDKRLNGIKPSSVSESHTKGVIAPQLGTYAYGWIDFIPVPGKPYYWHNGSIPGAFSLVMLYPSFDAGVIEMVNTSDVPYDLGISQINAILNP